MTISFASWRFKATGTHTHTHTAYVILIELLQLKCEISSYCFPRQQLLQKRPSVFALVRKWPVLLMTTIKVFYIDKLCKHKWLNFYYFFNSGSSMCTFGIMLLIIRYINKRLHMFVNKSHLHISYVTLTVVNTGLLNEALQRELWHRHN